MLLPVKNVDKSVGGTHKTLKSLKEIGSFQVKIHFTSEIEAMINVSIEEE